ncbi:MAG: TRL domain-containing protein [Leptonema sp. (in: bacteria)]
MKLNFIIIALLLLSSCRILDLRSSYEPPAGYFYQNITINHFVSPKSDIGSRQGKSCIISWFNLFSIGDASIRTTAAIAGIKEIRAIDFEVYRILGFVYEEFCILVQGE